MTIQEIYQLAVKMGMDADPRGKDRMKSVLLKRKEAYKTMSSKKKKYFDLESLENPYTDTRVLFGDTKKQVKKLMAGIDADSTEVLLVDRLNQKGEKIDLLIGHHPTGHALASLHEVMDIQIDTFAQHGVPENVAHALLEETMGMIKRRIGPRNNSQTMDVARLLGVPLVALHTVWDNLGDAFMRKFLEDKKFDNVGEIVDAICEIPEFEAVIKDKSGPNIVSGSEKS